MYRFVMLGWKLGFFKNFKKNLYINYEKKLNKS